jgi:tellurite resistance protein
MNSREVLSMGRTVPTFRAALEDEIRRWDGYRKALRKDEREAFDRMMDACRLHSSASGHVTRPEPLEAMLMSILLEHQRRLEALEGKIGRILEGMKLE